MTEPTTKTILNLIDTGCTSIHLSNAKNNDSATSKFTPEMHSQAASALPCLAPLKKSKFSKMLLQKKKPVTTTTAPRIAANPTHNKTPAASVAQQPSKATNLHRLLQCDLTNPELLSSTSSSMLLDDTDEPGQTGKFKKLELKFSMEQEDCDDASKSSEMMFLSMSSYVDTSKLGTNDTISFLHQSNMNDSEFLVDNKKLLYEPVVKIAVNAARDEFMDASF